MNDNYLLELQFLAFKVKTMHLTIGHTIEFEIIETVKSSAYGDAIVLDTAYLAHIKDIQLHSFKKNAFCLKPSHFINKYDPLRSQLCQWPRLVHNCNQNFNMSQPSVYFDSHQNFPASHLGIPGGNFIVTINFNLIFITQFSFI